MDVKTGEIKPVDELTPEQLASERWVELDKRPNPGCRRCHGRGYTGRDLVTGNVIICRCVKKRPVSVKKDLDMQAHSLLRSGLLLKK